MKNLALTFLLTISFLNISLAQTMEVEDDISNLSDLDIIFIGTNSEFICNPTIINFEAEGVPHFSPSVSTEREKERDHDAGDNYTRSLRFKAKFKDNCSYNHNNANQLDWNKLLMVAQKRSFLEENFSQTDATSIRLGWRWNNSTSRMELGLYGHIKHNDNGNVGREFLYLTDVALEEEFHGELILSGVGMGVIVNGKGSFIKREDILDEGTVKTVMKRNAYFGGQECPPHFMRINLVDLKADGFTNWNTSTCYKTFSRSIFYNYDNFDVIASNEIILSEQVFRGQYDSNSSNSFNSSIPTGFSSGDEIPWFESEGQRYVKIKSGANIRFKAGDKITLLPGFRAEQGSNFSAIIDPAITCSGFNLRTANSDLLEDTSSVTNELIFPIKNSSKSNRHIEYKNSLITIFPNPANNNFTINASEQIISYVVYDVSGKQITEAENTSLKVKIFPNPNKGIFSLEILNSNPYSFEIINATGAVLYKIEHLNTPKIDLNQTGLPSGIYYIRIMHGTDVVIKK